MKILDKIALSASLTVIIVGAIYVAQSLNQYSIQTAMIRQAQADASDLFSVQEAYLDYGDGTYSIKHYEIADIDFEVDRPKWFESLWQTFKVGANVTPNRFKLTDKLNEINNECRDAEIMYDDTLGWSLVEESTGLSFDLDPVVDKIMMEFPENNVIDISEFCHKPKVESWQLQKDYEKVDWLNNFRIDYECGVSIDGSDLTKCLNGYELDDELLSKYLTDIYSKLSSYYKTTDKSFTFVSHLIGSGKIVAEGVETFETEGALDYGPTLTVPYNTYGKQVNWDVERETILTSITEHKSLSGRIPELVGYDDLSTEYIEVSLGQQHVWHIKNGSICCESDCVTGTKGRRDTPTGVFYICEMIPGKYLRGADYVTWVNRWMRITWSGVGLHDAGWRSSFGKNIYTYNGSHGCINLPKKYAYSLYDEVKKGTAVVVY